VSVLSVAVPLTSAQVSSDAGENVEKIGDRSGTARGPIARKYGARKIVAGVVEPGGHHGQEDGKERSSDELCGISIAPRTSDGGDMDGDYVFLCGVMWCGYGQQEAGKELLRATRSPDPDVSSLAWAMLAKGTRLLREKAVGHPHEELLEDRYVDETMPLM
jgi:hypothetical protein